MAISIIDGKPSFHSLAVREMAGFNFNKGGPNDWSGWGHQFSSNPWQKPPARPPNWLEETTSMRSVASETGLMKYGSIAGSVARVGQTGYFISEGIKEGYQKHGLLGAAWGGSTWALSEYLTSGMVASAVASGGGFGTQLGMTAGGSLGMMATGGSPLGNIAGTWLAGQIIGETLVGTAVAAAAPVMLAGLATAGAAYMAGRGTYNLLEAGYQHRQKQLTNINTAGSTAAFMNKNAYTMRSKAIETIRNNQLNARSAFGQEAQRIHFQAAGRKFRNSGTY